MDYSEIADVILAEDLQEDHFKNEVIRDFWICCVSRFSSLAARKEVLTGKAKFGITGDGKEVVQVALARAMKKGDWRSGYYRDQTLMFALGISSVEDFFAQLYADCDNDPFSGGRQMNNHFATRMVDTDGNWISQTDQINVSSDVSCTAGQMARALGLAMASKLYRDLDQEADFFTNDGNEVCICTIGDASTSEGIFWETVNAAAVLKLPLAVSVWDDGYGISVPTKLQTTKGSISKLMEGFLINENDEGMKIYTCAGWDYPELVAMYERGIEEMRTSHIPALFHVTEVTQPQGHSTSGSHERYKSQKRLLWEREHDCILRMEKWMIDHSICTEEHALSIRRKAKDYVKKCRDRAKARFYNPVRDQINYLKDLYDRILNRSENDEIETIAKELDALFDPLLSEVFQNAKRVLYCLVDTELEERKELENWLTTQQEKANHRYHQRLYSENPKSALDVPVIKATYDPEPQKVNGFQVLNKFFDAALAKHDNLIAFGEDVGKIGGVNQGFAGMQEKYGEKRVFDTGIREWSIIGQAV